MMRVLTSARAADRKKEARGPFFFMRTAEIGTPNVKPMPVGGAGEPGKRLGVNGRSSAACRRADESARCLRARGARFRRLNSTGRHERRHLQILP